MHPTTLERRASRAGVLIFQYILQPAILLLAALGGRCAVYVREIGRMYAVAPAFGDGVSPASVQTGDLPQSQIYYYDKSFVASLKASTPWMRAVSRRKLPEKSGNRYVLFMYGNLGPNAVQAAEGTIGAGITPTITSNSSVIGQYADYMNFSDRLLATTIDPALENASEIMAYRAAQTINSIIQATADQAVLIDPSVAAHSKAAGVPMTSADIRTAIQGLAGRDVVPFDGTWYSGIVHPFIIGDVLNDTTFGGLSDVLKRTAEGNQQLKELPSPDNDDVPVLEWGGARFMSSTLVKKTTNYLGSGMTALRTYIMGQDAVIAIDLGGTMFTGIGDGRRRNLQMWVKTLTDPSGYDPSRLIGGFVSYNFMLTATLPPDLTQRVRIIDAVPVTS